MLLNSLQTSEYDVFVYFLSWFSFISDVIQKITTSSWPDKGNMPSDRKRLLGYVETIQLTLGVTDK